MKSASEKDKVRKRERERERGLDSREFDNAGQWPYACSINRDAVGAQLHSDISMNYKIFNEIGKAERSSCFYLLIFVRKCN